jgi:uncharacterized protein (DUF433 family)
MKRAWKIAGIALAIALVGTLAFGAVALADEEENPVAQRFPKLAERAQRMKSAFALKLGVSEEDLDTAWSGARADVIQQALDEGTITQEQADKMLEQESTFLGPNMMGRGRKQPGKRGVRGVDALRQGLPVVAEALDMTPQELMEALQDGATIAELADEQGVELDDITEAIVAKAEELLATAVENERITQEQADEILANLVEQLPELYERDSWPQAQPQQGRGRGQMPGRNMMPGDKDFPGWENMPDRGGFFFWDNSGEAPPAVEAEGTGL